MSDWFGIALTVVLLGINAFFVGAEFSIIAARRDRLETLIAQGKRRARIVLEATEHLSMMLAAAQLGITIASLLLGKISEPAIAHLLEKPFGALGVPESLQHPISFAIALLFISVLHILLGEMVPKNIALAGPESMAMMLIPVHMVFYRLTKPLLVAFNWIARHTLRLFGIEQKDELDSTINSDELASMIAESRQEGLLDDEEHRRLRRALASADRTVREVLIPNSQVRRIPTQPTVGDLEKAVAATGFSRFPVESDTGLSRGYVHVKDVLDRVLDPESGPDTPIPEEEIRELITINAEASLDEALRVMRRHSAHMAIAVANGSEELGIVALEDLIEEHVGVVRDWTHKINPVPGATRPQARGGRGGRISAESAAAKATHAKTAAVKAATKVSSAKAGTTAATTQRPKNTP